MLYLVRDLFSEFSCSEHLNHDCTRPVDFTVGSTGQKCGHHDTFYNTINQLANFTPVFLGSTHTALQNQSASNSPELHSERY